MTAGRIAPEANSACLLGLKRIAYSRVKGANRSHSNKRRSKRQFKSGIMEFHLFEASNGECPYLAGREWVSYLIQSHSLDHATYEALLNQGFRRSGGIFYKNKCSGCAECVSLRIPTLEFSPSKSQRKIWNRNQDLEIHIGPSRFDEEAFQLYVKFTRERYQNHGTAEEFKNFLANSQFETLMMEYRLQGVLVGVGWLD